MKVFLLTILCALSVFAKTIDLTEDNHVLIRGEISVDSVSKAQVALAEKVVKRGTKAYTLYLVLDTPGGDIQSGLGFIEFLKTIKNLETVTLFAASMGSAIVEGTSAHRNITGDGILMFHRAAGGVEGQFETGELESRLEFYKKVVRQMEQDNADRMSISLQDYKAKVKDEFWTFGKEAVSLKAADEVVLVSCSAELMARKVRESFLLMGIMPIEVEFSACPIIRAGSVVDPGQQAMYNKYLQTQYGKGALK
jgi:ATP-dependent protease ClpP protease subunit